MLIKGEEYIKELNKVRSNGEIKIINHRSIPFEVMQGRI